MIKIKIDLDIVAEFQKEIDRQKQLRMTEMVVALKEVTPVDTGEARDGWRLEDSTIVNDVEHISDLNEGSSEQAPKYFIEETLLSQPGVRPRGTITRSK